MLSRKQIELLVKKLKEKGAKEELPPAHALYKMKKDKGVLTIYKTGSITFGGKDPSFFREEVVKFYLQNIDRTPRIGCDEAGKGEFIGPLVVACVYADEKCLKKLVELGVKDSKSLSKERILKMAEEIKKHCRGQVKVIMPSQYNRLYEKYRNLNRLLEAVYVEILEKLIEKYHPEKVIVDKFSSKLEEILKDRFKGIQFEIVPKAERDPVVAAASIVAKAERLRAMDELRKELGVELPEGNLDNQKILQLIPSEIRHKFVKMHFKTDGSKR
jgi:ribonuclease HIII